MLGLLVTASLAEASVITQTYGFSRFTSNSTSNVASQLSMVVSGDTASNTATFKFFNNVGTASSITDIYFQDGTLLSIASVSDSGSGVAFTQDSVDTVTPSEIPGANLLNPDFKTHAGFSADSDSPITANGVNKNTEWVAITFTLKSGQTITDVINALHVGYFNPSTAWNSDGTDKTGGAAGLRVGLHVQGQGTDGKSDSYVNGPSDEDIPNDNVPEPATLAVFGCLAFIGAGARFVKKQSRA